MLPMHFWAHVDVCTHVCVNQFRDSDNGTEASVPGVLMTVQKHRSCQLSSANHVTLTTIVYGIGPSKLETRALCTTTEMAQYNWEEIKASKLFDVAQVQQKTGHQKVVFHWSATCCNRKLCGNSLLACLQSSQKTHWSTLTVCDRLIENYFWVLTLTMASSISLSFCSIW